MKFRNHAILGLIGGTVLTVFMPTLYTLPITFLGSIFPDIDIKSKSSRILYLLIFLSSIGLYFYGQISIAFILLAFSILPQLTSHRGFFHSITACIGLSAIPIYFLGISNPFSIPFCVGFIIHLIADKHFKLLQNLKRILLYYY